jgi:outer membrane biosynthesis protein TonB
VAGVQQRYGTLKACYEQSRRAGVGTPDKVRLDVRWIIELDGSVGSVGITDATHTDEALNGCVSRAVKRMKFLPPNGGVCVVNMPFNFGED